MLHLAATPTESAKATLDALSAPSLHLAEQAAEQLLAREDATCEERAVAHAALLFEKPVRSMHEALDMAVLSGEPQQVKAVLEHFGDINTWPQAKTYLRDMCDAADSRVTALLVEKGLTPIDQEMHHRGFTRALPAAAAPHFANVATKNYWRLLMDGDMHGAGYLSFDRREPGYMGAMMNGLQLMMNTLNDPVTPDLLCRLHDVAVRGVRDGLNASAMPRGFRAPRSAQVRPKVATLLERYHSEIGAAGSDDEKLTAIVRCVQDLEQMHPFTDGNIRTLVFLLGNKLLMQNGMPPAIYANPNVFDGFSVQELVNLVKQGQERFLALKKRA